MVDSAAIERIEELAVEAQNSRVQEIEGFSFHVSKTGVTQVILPTGEAVKCFSLTQMISFLKAYVNMPERPIDEGEHLRDEPILINVENHERVVAIDNVHNDNGRLSELCISDMKAMLMFKAFDFGQQMTHEDIVIALMTKFVMDDSLRALLKFISSVRAEKVHTSDDDGISQVAAVKAGVHLTGAKDVQNLWHLQTYKTFPEVEQPVIPYILRLHQRDEEMPKFALYECDGGLWKIKTTIAVREYLKNRLNNELGEMSSKVVVL